MKVFVSGATGVLGRAIIPVLVASGHVVRALTRSPEQSDRLRSLGAIPVRADLFVSDSLSTAMTGCDAVLHLASNIPAPPAAQQLENWRDNDRIRRTGTRNLVDAALALDMSTFVYPSGVFLYPDSGDAWIDERILPAPPATMVSDLDAEREVERFTAAGGRGVILRLGRLYGADNPATMALLRAARQGIAPTVGRSEAYESWLCQDDAATAFRVALERVPAGIYNVVDDTPLRRRDEEQILAQAVGRQQLSQPFDGVDGQPTGALNEAIGRSLRVSNRRFKAVSGWTPSFPSLRDGLTMILVPTREAPAATVER